MKNRKTITILVILCLASTLASAGVIRIMLKPIDVKVEESGTVKVDSQLVNMGDEAAENVRVILILDDEFTSETFVVGTLPINSPVNISFDVTIPEGLLPGIYPAVVVTDYTDLNNYPFSSVTPGVIRYKNSSYPLITATMKDVSVEDGSKVTLPLNVRNIDEKSHNLKVKLYLPREIKSETNEIEVTINGKDEQTIGFEVSPFGALPQSSYLTFVSIEYEDDGEHFMVYPSKPGLVSIGGGVSEQQARKVVADDDKTKLGESWAVKLIPYALILFSIVVIYVTFKKGD
ncbi:MAG: hypothetical protein ABH851_02750 [Methanobacteriota archaeon]